MSPRTHPNDEPAGAVGSSTIPGCHICGALLAAPEKHAEWHSDGLAEYVVGLMARPSRDRVRRMCVERRVPPEQPELTLLCSKPRGHRDFHYDPHHDWSWLNEETSSPVSSGDGSND